VLVGWERPLALGVLGILDELNEVVKSFHFMIVLGVLALCVLHLVLLNPSVFLEPTTHARQPPLPPTPALFHVLHCVHVLGPKRNDSAQEHAKVYPVQHQNHSPHPFHRPHCFASCIVHIVGRKRNGDETWSLDKLVNHFLPRLHFFFFNQSPHC
jgi:hypothetical protein